jgi:adenylate kinase family enzyme
MNPSTCDPLPAYIRRICVIGTTGSGKSTLADELARRLHAPHIELDSHHWLPGWQEADREVTRHAIEKITHTEAWVSDGNYGFLRDILWRRAQALVWLDYSLPLIFWRLWWRTWRRVLTKEVLWGTNTEKLAPQFFNKDSLFLWALKTHGRHRKDYVALPGLPEYSHLKVYRFKSPRETEKWLLQIGQ